MVCVCTEEYCDTLEDVDPKNKADIVLVSTSLVNEFNVFCFEIKKKRNISGRVTFRSDTQYADIEEQIYKKFCKVWGKGK